MKIIINTMKRIFKKSTKIEMLLLTLSLMLIVSLIFNKARSYNHIEGFTSLTKPYELKENDQLYDNFYSNLYDNLLYSEFKNTFEINKIKKLTNLDNNSYVLDIGSGTGQHVNKLTTQGYKSIGMDKSKDMIEISKKKFPKCKYIKGDVLKTMTFENSTYSHITCLYFTIYYIDNKRQFFENCHAWLEPGGYLILHLVNKDKFNPIVPAGDVLPFRSLQDFTKERITETKIDLKNYTYEAKFDSKKGKDVSYFKEKIINKQNNKIRENNHKLYMEDINSIIKLAKQCKFNVNNKVLLEEIEYKHQYLYILQKYN